MAERMNSDNSITMRIRVPLKLRDALRAAASASGEHVDDFVRARLWSALAVPAVALNES